MAKNDVAKTDSLLISETEAAVLLGLTPSAVSYMFRTGRLSARWIGGRRHYDITVIRALKAHREGHPERRGRPSAAALLLRRQVTLA